MDKIVSNTPRISVIMGVYNDASYVRKAIDSILNQTYKDFEFIIINDGSTDDTAEILATYDDPRVINIAQNNQGLVASLNRGIKKAKGTFIARQDADDYSEPDRLEKQMLFLGDHKNTVVLGSSMKVMDNGGRIRHKHHVLLAEAELKQELLLRSPFAHGSVIFNKKAALQVGMYKQDFWPAEDYELWLRLSKFGDFANINEPLYVYRENTLGISLSNKKLQLQKIYEIQALAWDEKERLALGKKIRLAQYKKLADGQLRIDRILANRSYIINKAWQQNQYGFALRLLRSTLLTPYTYRNKAGKLVRKAKGYHE